MSSLSSLSSARAPELVAVPAGRWRIGAPDPGPLEQAEREVELGAFRVARAPVRNAEYRLFVEATGHPPSPFAGDPALSAPDRPAVGLSWFDARAYLDWLGSVVGDDLRLPTAEEREVAARAGRSGPWPWGQEPPQGRPELADIAGLDRPHVPDPSCANAWGLSCMADNVHEWCLDRLAGRPGRPERRLSCGGSWRHRSKFTPVAARSSLPPDRRYADYGFRVFADEAKRR